MNRLLSEKAIARLYKQPDSESELSTSIIIAHFSFKVKLLQEVFLYV